jgi:hypothetical protein
MTCDAFYAPIVASEFFRGFQWGTLAGGIMVGILAAYLLWYMKGVVEKKMDEMIEGLKI